MPEPRSEIEASVIGNMIQYPDSIAEIQNTIRPEALRFKHREIFTAIGKIRQENGQSEERIRFDQFFQYLPKLEPLDFTNYIDRASTSSAGIAQAKILQKLFLEDEVRRTAQKIVDSTTSEDINGNISDLIDLNGERHQGQQTGVELLRLDKIIQNPDTLKPPAIVARNLAWQGRVTLLAGREKSGKSTLASAAAAAVSAGYTFLGSDTRAGNVLVLSLEDHLSDTANRLTNFENDPSLIYILERVSDPFRSLETAAEQVKPALIVVDTLSAITVGLDLDSGSSSGWTAVMVRLVRIARQSDAAMLLLHHATKSGSGYRDSSAIGANVDCILEMNEGRGESIRKVSARGRWEINDFQLRLITENGSDRYELCQGEISTDALVLAHIEQNPGCNARELREQIEGGNKSIDVARKQLEEKGMIENRGEGQSHAYYISKNQPCPDPGHGQE